MTAPTIEQLWGAFIRRPITIEASSASDQFAGITALVSGTATVTVSTTEVRSDSLILHSVRNNTDQTSGDITRAMRVSTISPGNFFTFGWNDGVASIGTTSIMWVMLHTV